MPTQLQNGVQYEEVLTMPEAASFLRVSEEALTELLRKKGIPAQQIGGEWRFLKRALAAWLSWGPESYHDFKGLCVPWLLEYPPWKRWSNG